MRKTWVKRENIYYKPFYKQKTKMALLLVFLMGISFIAYQAFSLNQLQNISPPWTLQQIKRKHKEMMQTLGSKQRDVFNFDDDGGGGGGAAPEIAANSVKVIRGTRLFDYDAYKSNFEGKFKCLDGSKEIAFDKVNDDFCDCESDGSDEPSTNACANGKFYCKYQKRHITGRGREVYVPSSRINDKVCDCCDGSDEWTTHGLHCRNTCT